MPRLLDLVAARLRELVQARIVLIALPASDGDLVVRATNGEGANELAGMRLAKEGSKAARVLDRRRSERVDSMIEDLEVDQEVARRLNALTGLYVPMILRERPIGVITAHDKEGDDARFSDEDVRLAEMFAARAAAAVDLSERVASDALRRVVSAQELERQRLARELHDETGQALTSILLGLKSVEDAAGEEDRGDRDDPGAGARRRDAPGREAPRGRAAAEGARRLRARVGTRAARRDLSRADGNRGRPRAEARRGAAAVRHRDHALPDHAGSPHERRQARAGGAA